MTNRGRIFFFGKTIQSTGIHKKLSQKSKKKKYPYNVITEIL